MSADFDPSSEHLLRYIGRLRNALQPFANIVDDDGGDILSEQWPDEVLVRIEASAGEIRRARAACIGTGEIGFDPAIATETRRAETTGSVEDEGAGRNGIAQKVQQ